MKKFDKETAMAIGKAREELHKMLLDFVKKHTEKDGIETAICQIILNEAMMSYASRYIIRGKTYEEYKAFVGCTADMFWQAIKKLNKEGQES